MKGYIEERVREIAEYITATGATVRQAAAEFGVSKSTVHTMEQTRFRGKEYEGGIMKSPDITAGPHRRAEPAHGPPRAGGAAENMDERHIRGGIATRRKYKGE